MLGSLHVLDACSLLNLVASRRLVDIARGIRAEFLVPSLVAGEVQYVRRGGAGPDARDHEPVELAELVAPGLLAIVELRSHDELAAFLKFAAEIDDGEASACALASIYKCTLVTDDRATRRVLSNRYPHIPVSTTSQVVKAWADDATLEPGELARVLIYIEERGNFRPGSSDPVSSWWESTRAKS